MNRGSIVVSLMRMALPSLMTWERIVRESTGSCATQCLLAERTQPRSALGPHDQDEPAIGGGENRHQPLEGAIKNLVELGPAADRSVDLENGLERLRRLDRAACKVVGAQVVETLQDRRVPVPRVVELDRLVVKDQQEVDDPDPAAIPERSRLKRRQSPAVELGASLAVEIHQVGRCRRAGARPARDGVKPERRRGKCPGPVSVRCAGQTLSAHKSARIARRGSARVLGPADVGLFMRSPVRGNRSISRVVGHSSRSTRSCRHSFVFPGLESPFYWTAGSVASLQRIRVVEVIEVSPVGCQSRWLVRRHIVTIRLIVTEKGNERRFLRLHAPIRPRTSCPGGAVHDAKTLVTAAGRLGCRALDLGTIRTHGPDRAETPSKQLAVSRPRENTGESAKSAAPSGIAADPLSPPLTAQGNRVAASRFRMRSCGPIAFRSRARPRSQRSALT